VQCRGINGKQYAEILSYAPSRSSIVGELDFFLQRPRSFLARADSPTELLVLPRPEFERMAARAPELATLLQARQHTTPRGATCVLMPLGPAVQADAEQRGGVDACAARLDARCPCIMRLQAAVLRCTSLSAAHALEALEKAGQN
jgi:hypothetical protein